MPPHNLTYTALGATMLWVGWFGFNAGSQLASDDLTSSAFAVTHFSAAAGAVAWACTEWITRGKPSVWEPARVPSPVWSASLQPPGL
jgi:Amt family ammonium transporter